MTRWIGVTGQGEAIRDTVTDVAPVQSGVTFLEVATDSTVDILREFWDGLGWVGKGSPPGPAFVFDYATKVWVLNTEQAWQAVRNQRDQLLASSDWTTLADVPLSEQARASWAAYRQALRDVTLQPGFPLDIAWPARP